MLLKKKASQYLDENRRIWNTLIQVHMEFHIRSSFSILESILTVFLLNLV